MIDQQEVGHQMRRGRTRLDPAEDVAGALQPGQRLAALLVLGRVRRLQPGDERADLFVQQDFAHGCGRVRDGA
jgi:hypothetical protein